MPGTVRLMASGMAAGRNVRFLIGDAARHIRPA